MKYLSAEAVILRTAEIAVGRMSTAVIARDFDDDGDMDLATVATLERNQVNNLGAGLQVLTNEGNDQFTRVQLYDDIRTQVDAADLNGDGRLDLVTRDNRNVTISFQTAQGGWAPAVNYRSLCCRPGGDLKFLDVDDDGDTDILIGNSYNLLYYENEGDGTLAERVDYETPRGEEPYFAPFMTPDRGDFDGDGDLDQVERANEWIRISSNICGE